MKRRSVKLCALVLAVLFLLTACGATDSASPPVQISGFESPEAAVVTYLEGLRDSDFDRMVGAFSLETHVEHFDLEAFLEHLRIYQLHFAPLPEVNEFTRAMNIELRRSMIVGQIRGQHLALNHPERHEFVQGSTSFHNVMLEEDGVSDFIREFGEIFRAPAFHTLEIQGLLPLEWTAQEQDVLERYAEVMARTAATHGADQMVSRIVVFTISGDYYVLFLDLAAYAGRWYIHALGGLSASLRNVPGDMHGIMVIRPDASDSFYDEIREFLIREW